LSGDEGPALERGYAMEGNGVFEERLEQIVQLAQGIEQRKDELLVAAAEDAGFPVKITAVEVTLALEHLRSMREEIPWVTGGKPFGTVAAILPYDAPVVVLARLGGAALLTGNRLRFSFSSWTPRSAAILADISRGIDVLEPILDQDNRAFGEGCVADPAVRLLFISGASAVGETYRLQHEAFDKLFFAGPGGMPAAVVFADADPEAASRFIARRAFINGGQYCTTIKKALIHRSLYPQIRDAVLESAENLKIGDPHDAATEIGPVRVERTRLLLERALALCDGARHLAGRIDGEWIYPLVLELDAIPDLELFGPFLALKPFDDPDQAVQELIRTRYGFLLAYFGTPPDGAKSLFDDNFGMVHDNPDFFFTPLRLPFGGRKASGWILERAAQGWKERDGAFLYSKELVKDAK
jgi:acyl-CoA reductase-like NAD-dependent aldehyde dehydrogenase